MCYCVHMDIGAREFKSHVGEYLDRVASGEYLTVTKRGKPVAELRPPQVQRTIADLVDEGLVEWSGNKPALPAMMTPLKGKGPLASDYVIEGRR